MSAAGSERRLSRFVSALAALIVMSASLSACSFDDLAGTGGSSRQVTVVGSGQVQGIPDTLTADISVEFSAADATSAMNQTNQRQHTVIGAVQGAGVESKDISTTGLALDPQYGTAGTITGYRAENSIEVKIRKLDSASHVLAVIIGTGGDATRINSVRYSIEDNSKLVKDARARAFGDAENRAEQYADLAGLELGQVISISEAPGVASPIQQSPKATEPPLEPGQQTVSFSVAAVWELY